MEITLKKYLTVKKETLYCDINRLKDRIIYNESSTEEDKAKVENLENQLNIVLDLWNICVERGRF